MLGYPNNVEPFKHFWAIQTVLGHPNFAGLLKAQQN